MIENNANLWAEFGRAIAFPAIGPDALERGALSQGG